MSELECAPPLCPGQLQAPFLAVMFYSVMNLQIWSLAIMTLLNVASNWETEDRVVKALRGKLTVEQT